MPPTPPPAIDPALQTLWEEARQEWGIGLPPVRQLLRRLAERQWLALDDLVHATALSHRSVRLLVRRLAPWLEEEGGRWRARPEAAAALAWLGRSARAPVLPPDPFETAALQHQALASMQEILAAQRPADHHLDHVPATAVTCLKRALYLASQFELTGATVLILGDHDLTSVALAHLLPEVASVVVDVDEGVLHRVDELARQHGWPIATLFADLRVELPERLVEACDLVFCDPPYAPAGVRLFLKRGLAALRPVESARLLLCYGFSERHPGLGLSVQSVLGELQLAVEAVLPHFNRYHGAEAVGSASALYVCRPTRRSRAAALAAPVEMRVYTRGRAALEGRQQDVPLEVAAQVAALLETFPAGVRTWVGEGWPAQVKGERMSLEELLGVARLGADGPRQASRVGAVAVNLYPHLAPYLGRVPLVTSAPLLVLCGPRPDVRRLCEDPAQEGVRRLLESAYHPPRLAPGTAAAAAVAGLERRPPPPDREGFVLRYLVDHPRAHLENAWREGLIAWQERQAGPRLTKNGARALVRGAGIPPAHLQAYLGELPLHVLDRVPPAVAASVAALAAGPEAAGPTPGEPRTGCD
ncbi:MAG: bis-aminopropyl spermidine synthase family protein [Candidatus Latescibacterota bacterium]